MNSKTTLHLPLNGGSALLVTFCVLCLTVMALLCCSTALAEQRLSESAAAATAAYYQADAQAEAVFAALRSGEMPPQVQHHGSSYSFSCQSGQQLLQVELQHNGDTWLVHRWQLSSSIHTESHYTLPVWNGMEDRP